MESFENSGHNTQWIIFLAINNKNILSAFSMASQARRILLSQFIVTFTKPCSIDDMHWHAININIFRKDRVLSQQSL